MTLLATWLAPWLWAIFTVIAAGAQTLRNAMQRELTATIGTAGATQVRFLFGLPFATLFLVSVLVVTGASLPAVTPAVMGWTLVGALSQIGATGLMLAAMLERSFVVTTALIKIEPVWVALFGLAFLGDQLSPGLSTAILIATAGVLILSWPRAQAAKAADKQPADKAGASAWGARPVAFGIASGMLFGVAAIGYRGSIRALATPNFVVGATTAVVLGLVVQTVILGVYLVARDRATLFAIIRAWRPSLVAGFMGAFASQAWFLAFAVESAARVRTLALVEILFAQILSRNLFRQSLIGREALGIALIMVGVLVLLNV
jgi:drug/metabolite transporter (DMT)-like permease